MKVVCRISVLINGIGLYSVIQYHTDGSVVFHKDLERDTVFELVLDLSMQNRLNHFVPPTVEFFV